MAGGAVGLELGGAAFPDELFIHFVHAFIEGRQELVCVLLAEYERRPDLQDIMELS
jgi:hypothetical protein